MNSDYFEDPTNKLYFSFYLRKTLQRTHSNFLHLGWMSAIKSIAKETMTYPLYPYHAREIVVIFVYGTDSNRQLSIIPFPVCLLYLNYSMFVTIISAAVVLCYIRRTFKLRRDGYISSFIDTIVGFIGGGTLRIVHKLERYFFGILMIGGIFLVAIWTDKVLDHIYHIQFFEVDTLKKLSEIGRLPVFVSPFWESDRDLLEEILRLVIRKILIHLSL